MPRLSVHGRNGRSICSGWANASEERPVLGLYTTGIYANIIKAASGLFRLGVLYAREASYIGALRTQLSSP